MSADLRQLIRQSSPVTVIPNQCCINAALINAHLYILSVTSVGWDFGVSLSGMCGSFAGRGQAESCVTLLSPSRSSSEAAINEAVLRVAYLHARLMVSKENGSSVPCGIFTLAHTALQLT